MFNISRKILRLLDFKKIHSNCGKQVPSVKLIVTGYPEVVSYRVSNCESNMTNHIVTSM